MLAYLTFEHLLIIFKDVVGIKNYSFLAQYSNRKGEIIKMMFIGKRDGKCWALVKVAMEFYLFIYDLLELLN